MNRQPIMDCLVESSVFTMADVATVNAVGLIDEDKNRELIKILFRKGEDLKPYENFTGALERKHQKAIAAKIKNTYKALKDAELEERNLSDGQNSQAPPLTTTQSPRPNQSKRKKYYKISGSRSSGKPKGRMLIINNVDFNVNESIFRRLWQYFMGKNEKREGSDIDRENLLILADYLDYYEVDEARNLTVKDMKKKLAEFAQSLCEQDYDSALVFVMSHGNKGTVYGTDNNELEIDYFVSALSAENCSNMAGKPKLFFIQACQGNNYLSAPQRDGPSHGVPRPSKRGTFFDAFSDTFRGIATAPGFTSWRLPKTGSYYINAICDVFLENSREEQVGDLDSMLKEVRLQIMEAQKYLEVDPELSGFQWLLWSNSPKT
uniref:Uncharacterized protein n=1 Tax=Plectus sambesii TaxID=2011161 RepID=A0A914VZF4_9BILA